MNLRDDLESMSLEELYAYLDGVDNQMSVLPDAPEQAQPVGGWRQDFGVVAPVEEGEEGIGHAEVEDLGRLILNAPGSILRNLGLIGEAITSPVQTLKGAYGLASGGIQAGARKALGQGDATTEDERLFWTVVGAMRDRYGKNLRKSLVEDPAGVLMEVGGAVSGAGLAARGAGMAGAASRLAGAARTINSASPVGLAGRMLGGVARGAERLIPETVLPEVMGAISGVEPVAPRLAYQAGRASRAEKRAFRDSQTGKTTPRELVDEGTRGMAELKANMSWDYDRGFDALPEPTKVRPNAVRKKVFDHLEEEFNIRPSYASDGSGAIAVHRMPDNAYRVRLNFEGGGGASRSRISSRGARVKIEEAVTELFDPDWTKKGMQATYLRLSDRYKGLSPREGTAKLVVQYIDRAVRNEAERSISGLSKVNADFSRTMKIVEEMNDMFSMKGTNPASKLRAIIGSMRDKGDAELKRGVLSKLEHETDRMILSPAAGSALSEWFAQGLHGRTIALGVFGGGFFSPGLWMALPFTSPRLVGQLMSQLGAFRRHTVGRIEGFLYKLREAVPEGMTTQGMTIGAVIQRMLEAGIVVPPAPEIDLDRRRLRSMSLVPKREPLLSPARQTPYKSPSQLLLRQ